MNFNCSELDNINIAFEYFSLIKQIGEELIKFILGYKQLMQENTKKLEIYQANFGKKLISPPENPKMAKIIDLTSKILEIISKNIELFQSSGNELENSIKEFESILKEKAEISNNLKKSSLEFSKSFIISLNEIKKTENIYITSLSKAEEIIEKYYIDRNKIIQHESGLGIKLNENEYNKLKEQQKNQLNEMNNAINLAKKKEEFYKEAIVAHNKIQNKFIDQCNSCAEKIKQSSCQISVELKKFVNIFMIYYKNNYVQLLSSIEICMNKFNKIDQYKEIDKVISDNFKNDNKLKNIIPLKYQLKSFSHLKHLNYIKNQNDVKCETNNLNNYTDISNLRGKAISNLEDGFDEMRYISDESLVMTIKSLFENFDLIEKEDFDIKFEEGKNRTQKYILKIIKNMNSFPFAKNGFYTNNNYEIMKDYEYAFGYIREELTNQEIQDLIELLNIHENRIIFLQKLNDYRGLGKFALCDKDYILLSQLFNIICDKIKDEIDYHAAEMIIILSETYFVEEKKKKKFLQESFKGNRLFKDKNFWENFLCYSINKEIMKTLKIEQKTLEDKQYSDYKYSNIVFSQILTLIDNMFAFDLDLDIINEVLAPKINFYKLNDEFRQTIKDVIEVRSKKI